MQYVKLFGFTKMMTSLDSIESEINEYLASTKDLVAKIDISETVTDIKIMLLMQSRMQCILD